MSQVSPPVRILLACAVAFLAAYMLFLRPKPEEAVPPAEPVPTAAPPQADAGGAKAETSAGKLVEKANEAQAAEDARAEELAGGTGDSAAAPGATAAAPQPQLTKTGAPAAAPALDLEALERVPARTRAALRDRKIVVLAVLANRDRQGADDRGVRRELADVDRRGGRVHVQAVPVRRLPRYAPITRGAEINQTPTVMVVDFALRATTLTGWSDAETIDQYVVDAMRNSGALFTSSYLRTVDKLCVARFPSLASAAEPASGREYSAMFASFSTQFGSMRTRIAAATPPKRLQGFDRRVRADIGALAAVSADWHAALGSKPTLSRAVSAQGRYGKRLVALGERLDRRMAAQDVLSCS